MAKDHMRVNSILAKKLLALMSKCFMLKTTAKTTAEKEVSNGLHCGICYSTQCSLTNVVGHFNAYRKCAYCTLYTNIYCRKSK